ncbi:MAG TPA: hypothetical protein VI341_11730 [Actinomycetota bacterium]
MDVAAGAQARPADPLGLCSFLCGIIAIAISAVLWMQQVSPSIPLAGYGYELSHGGALWDQAVWLICILGGGAMLAGFLSTIGGRARWTTSAGIAAGTLSLVYPALVLFDLIDAPLRPILF